MLLTACNFIDPIGLQLKSSHNRRHCLELFAMSWKFTICFKYAIIPEIYCYITGKLQSYLHGYAFLVQNHLFLLISVMQA